MGRLTPTWVEIDLTALRRNFLEIRKRLGPGVQTLAVVKSNAYGHGSVPVARTLQAAGADLFGVGTLDEGVQLREAGVKKPILILLGLLEGHFSELVRYQLTPVLYDLSVIQSLDRFLRERGEKLDVHLKIDTGMTRLGILPDEAPHFFEELKKQTQIRPLGLMTHLADAGDLSFTRKQILAFEKVRMEFQKRFPQAFLHLANSLASLDRRHLGDAVRLGIALYGAYPLTRQRRLVPLRPVMSWKSRLILVKKVPKGSRVGYGKSYTTRRPTRIGVIPVGYADGYPRLASNRASVLVRGKRAPVVGTVCMDMMTVDLTKIPAASVKDEVVLLGPQKGEAIAAEELGKWAETISYEIFCQVADRLPRHYLGS